MRGWSWGAGVLVAMVMGAAPAAAASCNGTASLTLDAVKLAADASVTLTLEGELLDAAATCDGEGATSYATTVSCTGGTCALVDGLRPGAWVHRIAVQVAGSDLQVQRQGSVVILGDAPGVANRVEWTIYPRTFSVGAATGVAFLGALTAARTYTASNPGPALIVFDPTVFPGADDPRVVPLRFLESPSHVCVAGETCPADGRETTVCFTGSRIVIDALDERARPGGVVLDTGTCSRSLFRMYGSDNVLRGLELRGSRKQNPTIPIDTVAITGAAAQRNRLEQVIVRGPTQGDAVSVEAGAVATVIEDSEVHGAEDRGIKVTTAGDADVRRSCVHDNRNGGVLVTFGGTARVRHSLVQHNVPGPSQNGISVGVPEERGAVSTLVTDGNLVRFAGARGISVVNAAHATLRHDFVTEAQVAGTRIETTVTSVVPHMSGRGLAFVCNRGAVSGTCVAEPGIRCVDDTPCAIGCGFPQVGGYGAVIARCDDCSPPDVNLGPASTDAGRNAFVLNRDETAPVPGVNLSNALDAGDPVPVARGNQWEHCGDGPTCDVASVMSTDVRPAGSVVVGAPGNPGAGQAPVLVRIEPARPRKGELVRVYNGVLDGTGGAFDAIAGAACTTSGMPADACSAASPEVALQNAVDPRGNRVSLTIGGEAFTPSVHAVTPTMLAFEMPVDCWAPATLAVARGDDPSAPVAFCDPGPCGGQPDGTPCDDGSICTEDDVCGGGVCGGAPVACAACTQCDGTLGCVTAPADDCRQTPMPTAEVTVRTEASGDTEWLRWRWARGEETTLGDLGDPTTGDGYRFCVFDESGSTPVLLASADVPPGGTCGEEPCWLRRGERGMRFRDPARRHGGVERIDVRAGRDGQARVTVRATGARLDVPAPPMELPLRFQLQASTGVCWESVFSQSGARQNAAGFYRGRSD
jgi:hypothetical protein